FTIDLKAESLDLCEPEPEIQKLTNEEANTSSFYPTSAPVLDKYILENGKVHLGSGVWVNEEKWHQLQTTQGDSKYTKNLAVMIWGTDVLKNRSVTGVATKKKKDASPKPPLSPHKLSVIRGALCRFLLPCLYCKGCTYIVLLIMIICPYHETHSKF
ncbi:hypothetical protein AB205_0173220, partial [Aquarana catesbeiana]